MHEPRDYTETTVERYLDVHDQTQYIAVERRYLIAPPVGKKIPTSVTYTTHDALHHECKLLADGSLANLITGATYRPV